MLCSEQVLEHARMYARILYVKTKDSEMRVGMADQ